MSLPLTLNAKQVAGVIGVSPWTIQMWKRLGLRFDYGNRTSLENVLVWRRSTRTF